MLLFMSHLARLHAFSFIIYDPAAGSVAVGSTQKQQEELILNITMKTLRLVSCTHMKLTVPVLRLFLPSA